jgi:DNA repair protein RadA/Sms
MATKIKTVFFCQNCGYESSKWMGQCPGCHEWNTMVEETVRPQAKTIRPSLGAGISGGRQALDVKPSTLKEIKLGEEDRSNTHIGELNRVLGGGLVQGSLTLVGGDPGIGKSTLLLQVCRNMSHDDHNILYISGEESLRQIKLRANRLGKFTDRLKFLCETNLGTIESVIEREKPLSKVNISQAGQVNINPQGVFNHYKEE